MSLIEERGYVHPEVLVSTEWVARNIDNSSVRLIESNEDQLLYKSGHIKNAVEVDWIHDLNDPVRRDYLDSETFASMTSRIGITPETTLVFYGDKNNWWACYALWVFGLFGHTNVKIMDGGRLKWVQEGRELTREVPHFQQTSYGSVTRDDSRDRVFRDGVLSHLQQAGQLVDVRSPEEFSGERLHMPDYPNEGALRGGHIPGARSIPWARAISPDDGTFLSAENLRSIYVDEHQLKPEAPTVAYCRIGERSSHTWFVLKYLLGFQQVRNYDGSWTEWGNLVGVPIERP